MANTKRFKNHAIADFTRFICKGTDKKGNVIQKDVKTFFVVDHTKMYEGKIFGVTKEGRKVPLKTFKLGKAV